MGSWPDELAARARDALSTAPVDHPDRKWLAKRLHGPTEGFDLGLACPIPAADAAFLQWAERAWQGIVFPLRHVTGRVVGFETRATEEKRYLIKTVYGDRVYPLFYGADVAFPAVKISRRMVVVEGAFDLLAIQPICPEAVAVLSANPWEATIRWVARLAQQVTILFDMDQAGRDGAHRLASKLQARGVLCSVPEYPAHDPDEGMQEPRCKRVLTNLLTRR